MSVSISIKITTLCSIKWISTVS